MLENLMPSPPYIDTYTALASSSQASPMPTFSTLDGQGNLATKSLLALQNRSPETTYDQSPGLAPPFDYSFYQLYTSMSNNYTGMGEISAAEVADFDYTYPQNQSSPAPLASGYAAHAQESRSSFDHFQSGSADHFPSAGSLDDLYLNNSQLDPLHIDIPDPSSDRRASEATVRLSIHVEHPFEAVPVNAPVDSDSWSSVAYSSSSYGSFNSSPSIQNNLSDAGTPFLGNEELQHRYSEPLVGPSRPSTSGKSLPSPSLSTSSEPIVRQRRGAISDQGYLAAAGSPSHPMLEQSVASQLYADNFQVETPAQRTPSVSRLSHQASTHVSFQAANSPSSSTSAQKPLKSTCADVKAGSAHNTSPGPSSNLIGRSSPSKSSDNTHYHPYTRAVKMSEHEQVIQFDNVPITQPSRKSSKRSRGSRRVYCTYVCPVEGKRCDGSVSREADMSRHMHKHKSEEEEFIASGRLKPNDATDFGELKPTGAAVCKGCNIQMSRKDALVRHLKKAGKECRVFYPEIALK